MMETRKSGLDIFRIMCCLGVLAYHVMDDILLIAGASFFYYAASFCVPGFFLLSGFLVGRKKCIDMSYCERKITDTFQKLFLWVVFFGSIYFLFTGQFYDVWGNFFQGAYAEGILPVAWFLFTYCVLLILAYPLHKALSFSLPLFGLLCVVWMVLLACGFGVGIVATRPQATWVHLYAGYFAVGMLLARIMPIISSYISRNQQLILAGLLFVLLSVCYFVDIQKFKMPPERYYGKWYYTAWLVSLFWFTLKLECPNGKLKKLFQIMSRNTFAVYLGHYPLLIYVGIYYPVNTLLSGIGMILFLFAAWQVAGELLRKLPVFRHLQ